MDILSYKRRALGYFPLDNWGGSSSNGDSSSTSSSGYGEGSSGGGYHSLGGISPSSSQAGGGGYQEEYQPPDDPVPAPAPPPVVAEPTLGLKTPTAPDGALGIANTKPLINRNDLTAFRTLASVFSGPAGLISIAKSFFDGSFDSLKANAPAWTKDADFNESRYATGLHSAPFVPSNTPAPVVAARPAERAGNHLYSTSRPIASDPYSTALPGFSLFPGTRPSTLTQSDPYYTQSQPANQNDGLVLAVLAGLAVIAFS